MTVPLLTLALLLASSSALAPQEEGETFARHERTLAGLDSPRAVAFGAGDHLYVLESGADRVRVFDAHGVATNTFGERGSEPGQLLEPAGLAVAPDGVVFVADTGNHRVQVFGAGGKLLRTFGERGAAPGAFLTPHGIAASADRVAVADRGNDRVQVFDHKGHHLATLGGPDGPGGPEPGRLSRPVDVALDREGRVYVADAGHHRVQVFDTDGHFERGWGDWGFFPGLFSEVTGIALHGGELYVSDGENHRVQVFTPDAELVTKWGIHAIRPREGKGRLHYPDHVAISRTGRFAALAEPYDDRVQIFVRGVSATAEIDALRSAGGQPSPHFGFDLDVDGPWMAIGEPETHTVLVYDLQWTSPRRISKIGGFGRQLGLWLRPSGVDLDARSRSLLVCDRGNRSLQVARLRVDPEAEVEFDPEMAAFRFQLDFARLGLVLGAGAERVQLEWTGEPAAAAFGPEGEVYVLDARNERVHVFDAVLRYVRSFGGHGTAPGQLRAPTAFAFAPDQELLYVVDAHNRRVQAFTPRGELRFTFGSEGDEALDEPYGICVDPEGRVFVSDTGRDRIVVYDAQGRVLRAFGGRGLGRLEFMKPRGLAIDRDGNLVVLDHGNHRGQVITPDGKYVQSFGSRLYTKPARLPETYRPEDYEE